nr:EOG090X0JRW [Lepidurus arcticus]
MAKTKKQVVADDEENGGDADVTVDAGQSELSYEEKMNFMSPIAKPVATKKLAKKLYKLIKKASKQKTYLRSGLKDVQRQVRKGETGLMIFAGDVYPIEIMCHMPAVCEEKDIPYIYTPSRMDIGAAMGVKRGCIMVLIRPHADYQELYNDMAEELKGAAVSA